MTCKPCIKCGLSERTKRGDCLPCMRVYGRKYSKTDKARDLALKRNSCPDAKKRRKELEQSPDRRSYMFEARRSWQLKRYGLTLTDYDRMLSEQNHVCAICGLPETTIVKGRLQLLSVDHCHKTNFVRGLLCNSCNSVLGHAKDSVVTLTNAIKYLEKVEHSMGQSQLPFNILRKSTSLSSRFLLMGLM